MSHYHEAAISKAEHDAYWQPRLGKLRDRMDDLYKQKRSPLTSWRDYGLFHHGSEAEEAAFLERWIAELEAEPDYEPLTRVPPARSLVPTGVIILSALAVLIGILIALFHIRS